MLEATRAAIFQCFREFAEPDLVVEDANLDSLGLDSLSVVELRNAIARVTGVELENAMILTNPSVAEIIETVLSNMGVYQQARWLWRQTETKRNCNFSSKGWIRCHTRMLGLLRDQRYLCSRLHGLGRPAAALP